MLRTLRATDGQASLEWVGTVALVAAVLVLGAAGARGAEVGHAITRQMARALCLVRAGDCWRDREPCVVHAKDEHEGYTIHAVLVKIGGGHRALVEQRSDGSVAVTDVHDGTLGLEASDGAGFTFKAAGLDAEAGAELEASIAARIGRGSTWVLGSMAAADTLVDDLRHHRSVPDPNASTSEDAIESEVTGSLSVEAEGKGVDVASAGFSGDRVAGMRVDHRTGHRIMFVQWSWDGSVSGAGGVLGASHSDVGDVYGVEVDARGRPIDLQVLEAGSVADGLPDVVAPAGGMLASRGGGSVYEVTSHLDLTERDNVSVARAVIDDVLGHRTPDPSAVQALRRRIDEAGTVEARILAAHASTGGYAVVGKLVLQAGVEHDQETRTLQLEAAASRGLDGHWLSRDDCIDRDESGV